MKPTPSSIFADAMRLTPAERTELLRRLVDSIDGGEADPAIRAAWLHEAERRLAAYRAGEAPAIDGDAFIDSLQRGERP